MGIRSITLTLGMWAVLAGPSAARQTTSGVPAFSQWSTFCEGVEHTTSIALGDIDRDGDLDLVFGNGRHLEEIDWVWSNNGHGLFYAKRALGPEADPTYGVALGDVDGDGAPDAIVANDAGDPSVVYRNDGQGNFTWLANLGPSMQARRAVVVGDLDGDGDVDVVLVGLARDDTTAVALADIDGDRDLDIVAPNWEAPHAIYLNDGRGGFAQRATFGTGRERAWSIAMADLDLDGDLDAVVGNANIDYWASDLDGDRRADRIGWRPLDSPSRIYLNDGKGRLSAGPTIGFGHDNTRPVAIGDVDGDGDADIVMGNDCQSNHVFFNSLREPVSKPRP